ncbi:MAG: nucleoside-diphosphate sugar epimerase [Candidatus Altiarchaeales archaeon ex4484_96]|nr:MAG: nucleoside-diphosphate sugar epimerase [Candidatus Altiarchaeales archaeon ex4484_96]
METERILVSGGKGFIGTNLVKELRDRGHEVWSCDLMNSGLDNYVRCDVSRYRQMQELFAEHDFDYVYHLAAEYGRWNGEDYYENLWLTNVVGTKHMLHFQQKKGFRLIHFSSAEVYGDYEGVMSENVMDDIAIKQMNDYAMTKWVNELQVINSMGMFATESVIVRPVNAYGPHEHYTPYRGVIPKFIYNALMDRPYTVYRGHKRIFDYVEDTCRTFANIVDNFKPGEAYNVGGSPRWECDIKHISDLILKETGKDDSNVTYKEAEPFTTRVKRMDFTKAVRDLNHNPEIPPDKGIPKTVKWFKEQHNL